MKQLNSKSTHIFLKLIKKLGSNTYVKLHAENFMPLSLEYLHTVQTPFGDGKLYSLAHTYVQNGDLMRDPEMCFIVVPPSGNIETLIFPQMYQQDSMGIYEESMHISNGRVSGVIDLWQSGHCSFANAWLRNILAQGFLK